MRRLVQAVAVLTIVLLLPFQAMAGICLDLDDGGGPLPLMELHLDLYEQSQFQGLFFALGGALLGLCAGIPIPLIGTAFLNPFGDVVFAMTIMAARGAGCVPAMLEGLFDPATLLGAATLVNMTGAILATLAMRPRATCSQL
jgi:hypothetical protein